MQWDFEHHKATSVQKFAFALLNTSTRQVEISILVHNGSYSCHFFEETGKYFEQEVESYTGIITRRHWYLHTDSGSDNIGTMFVKCVEVNLNQSVPWPVCKRPSGVFSLLHVASFPLRPSSAPLS